MFSSFVVDNYLFPLYFIFLLFAEYRCCLGLDSPKIELSYHNAGSTFEVITPAL
ncbi:hypothetical protein SODALDRAFT_52487 [Sodiomyces alkalinus F11]|uniref:Uncharacterized protein n=1 Tax=Sodiomyces alkalinus (strain CBS 110278 / VKM F-3762 / F11) TaxID=1314773 RepID=A0A3N2PND1_SODAK|nr:hypothetical protein SODALDRAFT_52487 [Sodiomyces alkalinus F11]ROT35846.1 hypothetical protein SODALDRAFT_52487 [Sodiomyces alkalinus F11]